MTHDPLLPPETAQFLRCHPLLQSHDLTMTSHTQSDTGELAGEGHQLTPHLTQQSLVALLVQPVRRVGVGKETGGSAGVTEVFVSRKMLADEEGEL